MEVVLTLKKNSVKSLKEWVSKIKRYGYELPKLYEKLEYLKVRSIGYNSPSFEPRISSNGSFSKSSIDYWLEKIEECENEIERKEKEIKTYKFILNDLNKLEQYIFYNYYRKRISSNAIIREKNIKRYHFYKKIKEISDKYYSIIEQE